MTLDEYKAKLRYQSLPEWRKFLHGWSMTLSWSNLLDIWKFPYMYYQMRKMLNAENTKCSIASCETKYSAKGLCPKHYQRFVSNNIPLDKFIEFMNEDPDNFNYLVTLYQTPNGNKNTKTK